MRFDRHPWLLTFDPYLFFPPHSKLMATIVSRITFLTLCLSIYPSVCLSVYLSKHAMLVCLKYNIVHENSSELNINMNVDPI